MSVSEEIIEAFRAARRPLTLEEVLDETGVEDRHKVRGLIYHLVNKDRLQKAEIASDGASRWKLPDGSAEAPPADVQKTDIERQVVAHTRAQRMRELPDRTAPPPTVASMMAASLGPDALPQVCVNFGTATVVITCGDDVVKIETLAAAQHLHAQMEQAIAALGALDGR